MSKKLFVSNLDFDIGDDQLRELFAEHGAVISAVVASDRESKRSKGFAFVEMANEEDADKAIKELNSKEVNGRPIKVVEDRGKGGGRGGSSGGPRDRGPREYLPPIQRMQLFGRKPKLDPFSEDPTKTVDYKDVAMLSRFVSERGKILSRKITGLDAYNQRKVAKAIKRAQSLGLMPYRHQ